MAMRNNRVAAILTLAASTAERSANSEFETSIVSLCEWKLVMVFSLKCAAKTKLSCPLPPASVSPESWYDPSERSANHRRSNEQCNLIQLLLTSPARKTCREELERRDHDWNAQSGRLVFSGWSITRRRRSVTAPDGWLVTLSDETETVGESIG